MSPLTLPKRLSIFSLGGGGDGGGRRGSSSLRRMATAKVSKSTDALSSLDSPSVLASSTPVGLTRTRAGGLRSSFLNLFRPSFIAQRRPSSPLIQPVTAAPGAGRPFFFAGGQRRPSNCTADVYRSTPTDDDDDDDDDGDDADDDAVSSSSGWNSCGRMTSPAPPALPRRPPHLLLHEPPSTLCNDRPLPLLPDPPPPIPTRQPSPVYIPAVSLPASIANLILLTL